VVWRAAAVRNVGTVHDRANRRWTRLLAGRTRGWADAEELSHAIDGTIVGAAAMAASGLHGTLPVVVVTVAVTVAVYWAADQYALLLGAAAHGTRGTRKVREVLRHGRPMIEAAYTPLVLVVVVALLTGDVGTSVLVGLVAATLLLGGLGHAAGRRAGASGAAAIGWGAGSAALGAVLVLLKLLLH